MCGPGPNVALRQQPSSMDGGQGVTGGFGSSSPSSLSLLHIPAADLQLLTVPAQHVPGSPWDQGMRRTECWKE